MSPITPAGHNSGNVGRIHIPEKSVLERELDFWLAATEQEINQYSPPYLGGVSAEEMHSAILSRADHPRIAETGRLVSHFYNFVREEIITYGLDVPLDGLGSGLRRNKILVNTGVVGNSFGNDAAGTIINAGTAGNFLGLRSKGLTINVGEMGHCFRHNAEDGMGLHASEDPYVLQLFARDVTVLVTSSGSYAYSWKNGGVRQVDNFGFYVDGIAKAARMGGEEFDKAYGRNAKHQIKKEMDNLFGGEGG